MKTPYFLISEEKLNANIHEFNDALSNVWPNSQMAYSVKTNSLPWLIKHMLKNRVFAEVVSDEEYQLAELCGYKKNEIVFNGPIKTKKQLIKAILKKSIVNIDSKSDLNTLLEISPDDISNIGIRINVDPRIFLREDIGYEDDGFRFGFAEENGELGKVFSILKERFGSLQFGLHFHCNSITRSLTLYRAIAEYAGKIIKKYDLKPSFIDIGGGFFGGVECKPTAKQYVSLIRDELSKTVNPAETKLFIEPGSAIIGSAVSLYTSVIDVKDTNCARIVTTDGSRIHIDPLWAKSKYMYSIQSNSSIAVPKQIICGYTCMDHDRIMMLTDEKELSIGDKIIYHRVGAYSVTFGGMFIRYLPDVFVGRQNGDIERIRERISVEQYYTINT